MVFLVDLCKGLIISIPVDTEELCVFNGGDWDSNSNRCIRTTIFRAYPTQIADFYRNNPITPTPGVKNVIAEYLNTEISAIPPIPLRIENKDFNDKRIFPPEYTETVTKIMDFFGLNAQEVKKSLKDEILSNLREQNPKANSSWIDNLFITFEVSVDSVEQADIKYLYLFFKKVAENTVDGKDITISLTSGAYRFNLVFDKLEIVEEGMNDTPEYPRNPLDSEQEYYSNYLTTDVDIPRKTRNDLTLLANARDTTTFRPTNRYNVPNKFKIFTVKGDVIDGYRRMSPHYNYKFYEAKDSSGLIGFRETVSDGLEPKAGNLRFVKPNSATDTRTVVKVTNLKIERFIRDTTYKKFASTIVSTATENVDGFSVPLSPKLLQVNDFTEANKIAVVKGSMAATVYIANVKVVKTKWWKKLLKRVR